MIFALGFFVSTLLGLMIVPALNERADRLARRRVEAQLPASVAELNAERDMLRAELAVRERRIERRLEAMREKQAADMAELGRRMTRIATLTDEGEAARAEIARLEQDLAITRNALADSEARAAGLSAQLLETRETLTARETTLADLQARHARALDDLDARRIEVSDLQTRLEAETGRAREIERVSRSRAEDIAQLRTALERTRKALADEEARGAVLERRAENFAGERDEAVAARAQTEAELALARDAQAATGRDLAARHGELEKASARIAALEGQFALSRRKLDASEAEARVAQEALRREIDGLRAEKATLQGALDHARSERRRIEAEFGAYRKEAQERLESENAVLRERIDAVTRLIMGDETPAADPTALRTGKVGKKDKRDNTGKIASGRQIPDDRASSKAKPDRKTSVSKTSVSKTSARKTSASKTSVSVNNAPQPAGAEQSQGAEPVLSDQRPKVHGNADGSGAGALVQDEAMAGMQEKPSLRTVGRTGPR